MYKGMSTTVAMDFDGRYELNISICSVKIIHNLLRRSFVTLKATYIWCYSFCQTMGIVQLNKFIPSMLHCLLKKKIQFSFSCSNFCLTLSQGTCFTPNILSLPGTGAVCITDSVTELHEIVLLIISILTMGSFEYTWESTYKVLQYNFAS